MNLWIYLFKENIISSFKKFLKERVFITDVNVLLHRIN